MKRKKLSLQEWIAEVGPLKVADILNVHPSAVRHWRRNYCLPRAELMRKIKKLSRGRISYESMIEGHLTNARPE